MADFSILIPTYNRKHKLGVVLDALEKQPDIERGEVVVGVDGSQDGTKEYLEQRQSHFKTTLRFFSIPNSGRAVIRNRLMDTAAGELLIFIQDDIVVDSGWLAAHLKAQKEHSGAVIGFVTWYPRMPITRYMKWLENGGHMLNFSGLEDGAQTDFWHFYMGNLSVPRDLLGDLRFDESFKGYGWEDIVLGYDFTSRGQTVYYSASARAFHWDEYREDKLPDYMKQVGESAVLAEGKFPGVGFVPPLWKRVIFQVLIWFGGVFYFLLPQEWKWYLQMKSAFLQAIQRNT